MQHADLAYSYRRSIAWLPPETGPLGTLAEIEGLLLAAAQAYRDRRFTDAVDGYQSARRLIWSQLSPLTRYDEDRLRTADIVDSLASFSAEWLNLLPVEQSAVGVRPRVEPQADAAAVSGLFSSTVTLKTSQAAADLAVASALTAVGNLRSASFYHDRAVSLDPDFVKATEAGVPGQPGVGPAPAPAGPFTPGGLLDRKALDTRLDGFIDVRSGGALLKRAGLGIDLPPVVIPPAMTAAQRFYAVDFDGAPLQLVWDEGDTVDTAALLKAVYSRRRGLKELPDVLTRPERPADVAAGLVHAWYYETTLGLAESYHALGDFTRAESWYQAAAGYRFINAAVEAPYVWARLAGLYLDWGNSVFRGGDATAAAAIYGHVLALDGTPPATEPLWFLPGLAPATSQAADVVTHLDSPDAIATTTSPAIQAVLFDIWSQLAKISGGLDFWGHWAANVPIWTFDYLQSVATTFTQLAISAERDAISFWERADAGTLTRTQLVAGVATSRAEQDVAQQQAAAASAELRAYQAGVDAATLRASDSQANADEYATRSRSWIMHQALSTQLSGGEDGDAGQLNSLADRMVQGGYSLSGDRGTLAAAESLTAARQQRDYEVHTMQRQANELAAAAVQAGKERDAAAARLSAAQAAVHAAAVRVGAAQQLLQAFDAQRFTPDVWNAMGEAMNRLVARYLGMALDVAKRMQRAYNFENDVELTLVKDDYSAQSVNGMLAADALLADIEAFTYDLVTSTTPSPQPVKQTISLAQRYPFLFETRFRRTGSMDFQTTVADFDEVYPGTYGGRIIAVEVAVDGILPPRGISGTLTNSGVSHYRVPNALWVDGTTELKHRVQNREALVLSDYDPRGDALLVTTDRRRRTVFEGAGVASSWTLDLPPAANDLDYASITDVRLTFTYQARFDPDLKGRVLAQVEAAPSAHERQRPLPLRWLFPDAFFSFYATGLLSIPVRRSDFGATENDPRLTGLGLVAVCTPRAAAGGLVLRVGLPGVAPVTVTTAADGSVDDEVLTQALTDAGQAAAVGASAVGDYTVEVRAQDNPALVVDGRLDLDAIDNIAFELSYSFTPGV